MANGTVNWEQYERLSDACHALEEQAGISDVISRAEMSSKVFTGSHGSLDEIFLDQGSDYDYIRCRIRDAYFSVEDFELRRKLIAKSRARDAISKQIYEQERASAQSKVDKQAAVIYQQPWWKAGLVAVASVAVGNWGFGIVGAIAGAVGGFFLGQSVIQAHSRVATELLARATNELNQLEIENCTPEYFDMTEETTGDRNAEFDHVSALINTRARICAKSCEGQKSVG